MTTPSQPPQDVRIALAVPPKVESGAYANFANIWHDNDGFILDFAVATTPPQALTDETTGQQFVGLTSKVVSRVRIPASQAFEFMKALNTQLTAWESEHGQGQPTPPTAAT